MSRMSMLRYGWPVVGLSLLLAAACLVSIAYISRLREDLEESLRTDSARLQAAQQAQIHLREYRVHTILLAAGPTEVRRGLVDEDRRRLRTALDALHELAAGPDDRADLDEVEVGWARYENDLAADPSSRPSFRSVTDLAAWADAHRVRTLLVPCNRLVARSEERMDQTAKRSREQTRWAGAGLLAVGLIGPLAGLIGGYTTARGVTRRVARLSVRVEAVRAQLDQTVGEVTLVAPQSLADLDAQLDRVVDRVQSVCRRLQTQERDLLRAEQLAAVGRLAAGITHEVRNPLTGIKMLVESAVRPVAPAALTRADLELIRDEIDRLERTVQGLLDYARPAPPARLPQDIRRPVARAAEVVAARAARSGVTIEVVPAAEPLVAPIDADRFASLLTNLLINALDATLAGGRVRIEAGREVGGRVRVAVSDSGRGLPAELGDALFTPFATTKPGGTGLGLAIARRVAEDHGGTLSAANLPTGGACFTVSIPAAEATGAEAPGR